ncbi:MAG: hypothetical protein M3Y39_01615 [Chloroflexota bacterium]|nr:hypothetical protein [Chloroflexota bacterium]
MSTRDLGKHIVELHTQGMLDITGEGIRVSLTAHEALELLHWLDEQREALQQMATESVEEVPTWMRAATERPASTGEELDAPVDEP